MLLALLSIIPLAGCDGSATRAAVTPSTSLRPSISASQAESASRTTVPPEPATTNATTSESRVTSDKSAAGAGRAVRKFNEVWSDVSTGQASRDDLEPLFAASCSMCRTFTDTATSAANAGNEVQVIRSESEMNGDVARVHTRLRQSKDGLEADFTYILRWENDRWIITGTS